MRFRDGPVIWSIFTVIALIIGVNVLDRIGTLAYKKELDCILKPQFWPDVSFKFKISKSDSL